LSQKGELERLKKKWWEEKGGGLCKVRKNKNLLRKLNNK
jgi:hypothetical protein